MGWTQLCAAPGPSPISAGVPAWRLELTGDQWKCSDTQRAAHGHCWIYRGTWLVVDSALTSSTSFLA